MDAPRMRTTVAARQAQATPGRSDPAGPAAATISGEGVSPAANAAANGSPPGSAAPTLKAERGRCEGSRSRQRRMARSTAGSKFLTTLEGGMGLVSVCLR